MIPALMGSAIKTAMSSKDQFLEDDEGTGHALLRHFGLSQFEMLGRMVPYGGNAVTLAEGAFGHGHQDQLISSPALKMVGDLFQGTIKDLRNLTEGEVNIDGDEISSNISSKTVTDFFTLIGMVSGLPLRPLAKPIGYLQDIHTGEIEGPTATSKLIATSQMVRGMLTGQ